MKTIEETMSIIHLENNDIKVNTLEEIKILEAASSKYLLNDVIAGQNEQCTGFSPQSVIWTPTINSPAGWQMKFRHLTVIKSVIWTPNGQLPKLGDRRTLTAKTCRRCYKSNERATGKNTTNWMGCRWNL